MSIAFAPISRKRRRFAAEMGGKLEREVDSIYLGGGTPTVSIPRNWSECLPRCGAI